MNARKASAVGLAAASVLGAAAIASAGAARPDRFGAAANTMTSCGEHDVGDHTWSITSSGPRPIPCSIAVRILTKLARKPVPKRNAPYDGDLYEMQYAAGMRCFGGPKAGKLPTSITCVAKAEGRRYTIGARRRADIAFPVGIEVRGPVPVPSEYNPDPPPLIVRFRSARCRITKSRVFSAHAKKDGWTLVLAIIGGSYRGPAFNEGVYDVPYGTNFKTEISFEGPAGVYSSAYPGPGHFGGVIAFGNDVKNRPTDRIVGAVMLLFDQTASTVVYVQGAMACKY
jgi:hypothetical protein